MIRKGRECTTEITGKSLSEEVGSELHHRARVSAYVRQYLGQMEQHLVLLED